MSYYDIKPSTPNGPAGNSTFTNQNPEYMPPLQQTAGGFRTRNVGDDELVRNQLTGLLDENGQYIQQARNQAAQAANARGLMNSSLAAGAGQAAAIQAGLPIAQQDAATYARTHGANMDAENQYLLNRMNNMTSRANTASSANASIQAAKIRAATEAAQLAAQQQQFGQNLDWAKQQFNQDWQHQQTQYTQNRNAAMFNTFMQQIAGNPDLWGNPGAATGFVREFAGGFNDLYNELFGG